MRILAALLLLTAPVFACSCLSPTVCTITQAPAVFIGEVLDGGVSSIREDPWYSRVTRVRFRVIESFRGVPDGAKTVDLEVMPTMGMCSPNPYFPGHTYLVSPSLINGHLHDGPCFSGIDIRGIPEVVAAVRDHFTKGSSLGLRGRVAVAKDAGLVEFLLTEGEAWPLAGVHLSTTKDGSTYNAITDENGRYSLPIRSPGAYDVRAFLGPYSADTAHIEMEADTCAVHDFALQSGSTISGLVVDGTRGLPVPHATVGLINLDRPPDSDGKPHFLKVYTGEVDASFHFTNVPIGRYLLVFNPDGPQLGRSGDRPNARTYYPRASARRTAKIVTVTDAKTHLDSMDLDLSAPVAFRQVIVRVRFPDGAPMTTAQLFAREEPAEAGEFPWTLAASSVLAKNGAIQFQAPAARPLRLEVRDLYGRDLSKPYVSTYAAGTTPIEQEFVIVP